MRVTRAPLSVSSIAVIEPAIPVDRSSTSRPSNTPGTMPSLAVTMLRVPELRRPAPIITDDSAVFWDAAVDHRLVVQACGECGRLQHPP
ncbi:MAG TPA: zinc ribbon domain-containing protein, partial [Acidimicrobiia bacterium]